MSDHAPTKSIGIQPRFSGQVRAGDVLHIWHKPNGSAPSSQVTVREADGRLTHLAIDTSDDFQMGIHVFASDGEACVVWDNDTTLVSLAYAYDPQAVMGEGIRVLWSRPEAAVNQHRFRLHLAPPFGWMNDPNGLIELSGSTHCFYQHYPHLRRWDTMHWGHATSKNLVDWMHLPVFLHPEPHMLTEDARKGGAFSGSAIADGDGGIRIFHTDREDGRRPEQEWQMTAASADLVRVSRSQVVITERPPLPAFGNDLRDPYVFKGPDGLWKMVLGGADSQAALVLLYETDDATASIGWKFVGVLHREALESAVPAECPCVVPLEGGELYALIFGLIGHQVPVRGRLNPSFALVGRFNGKTFEEISRRELDFIGDCYAFQGFVHQSGPMGFAWAANWAEVRKSLDFPSAMTFPRKLISQDNMLLMPAAEAVTSLRVARLSSAIVELERGVPLSDGLAQVDLECAGQPFNLTFSHSSGPITLTYDGAAIEFRGRRPKPRHGEFDHQVETGLVQRVEIYIDVGLIEIYIDGGRINGTKRIDSDDPVTCVRLDANGYQGRADVWQLRAQSGAVR